MKNTLVSLLWSVGVGLMLAANPAQALICKYQGSSAYTQEMIEQVKAQVVQDAVPAGTEIWRSAMQHANLYCVETWTNGSDQVVLYVNPENVTPIPGVQIGILYQGKTYWGGTAERNTYGEFIRTPYYSKYTVRGINESYEVNVPLDFQVIMRKNAAAIGEALVDRYDAFSMGGLVRGYKSGDIGQVRRYTFTYKLNGLKTVKRMACVPTVKTTPAVITFDPIKKTSLEAGQQGIASFSLDFSAQGCSAPVSIDVVFSSQNTDAGKTVIFPSDNATLGISIRERGKSNIVLDTPVTLLENWSGGLTSRPLEAVLSRRTSKVNAGTFSAIATMTMQYR